ncbi:hypothetical protein [Streptomyces celluloflavus]|uniref:hypothetical protein n=1 Tax=Streptomyces celluloflavus TaxID=58344 RepID=UPI003657C93D
MSIVAPETGKQISAPAGIRSICAGRSRTPTSGTGHQWGHPRIRGEESLSRNSTWAK